jgi:excisionase family DNA binding protein
MSKDAFTTVSPAARILGLSPDRVRRLVDAGQLRAVKLATGLRLIDVVDLQRLAAERAAQRSDGVAA